MSRPSFLVGGSLLTIYVPSFLGIISKFESFSFGSKPPLSFEFFMICFGIDYSQTARKVEKRINYENEVEKQSFDLCLINDKVENPFENSNMENTCGSRFKEWR